MRVEKQGSLYWLWLLALFTVAGFVEAGFYGQIIAFTPLYLPRLGIPVAEVAAWTGIIVAWTSAIGIPLLPFWGALADRFSRQPIIIRSYVAHLLASILMLVAGNVWIFSLGRAAMNFSLGNSGLMMTTLSERAPARRMGLAFAIMNSASPLGLFVGPLAGGIILDNRGFPMLMLLNCLVIVGVIIMLTFGYHDSFKGTARGSLLRMAMDSIKIIWHSLRLRALFPALFLLFAGWVLALTYVPVAATSLYHGTEPGKAVGMVVATGGLTTLVLSPLIGALADRFGYWRMLFIGAAVEVLLWPLPALAPDLVSFAMAWALINGVTSAVFAISFTVLSSSAASDVRGRVMSFAYLPLNVGSMVGPALGTIITRSSVMAVFPAAAIVTVLGIGVLAVAARLSPSSPMYESV